MLSAPGCWAAYGELLAKSYGEFNFPPAHRIIVDAYAVQHPGEKNDQAVHSVALHLIRLFNIFEIGYENEKANGIMSRSTQFKGIFTRLEPPSFLGGITAVDVAKAITFSEYQRIVNDWGLCAWRAWEIHHEIIRKWANI